MTEPPVDIIIIGAGIAGLAAGCYAQMNGYQTRIFEMHHLPGGLCTAWERKGYVFDGCIHYLFGSGPGQPFHGMWEELGAIQNRRFINHQELMRICGPRGEILDVYSDPDRLEQEMKSISPQDGRLIESFCQGIRQFTKFDMEKIQAQPRDTMSLLEWGKLGVQMLPYALPVAQWGLISAGDFAARFQDPFLRKAIPQMMSWPEIPVMVGMSLLAYMYNQNAGVPVGASLEFARALEKRYLELGGIITYKSQVECILVENHQAVGVRLYNNEEFRARRVVSASDGQKTIFDLLGGKFTNRSIQRLYDGHMPIHSQLQVSLGVDRDLSADPHWVTYLLDRPLMLAGEPRYEIGVKNYCFDPSLAPQGKSVLIVMLTTTYPYWQRIYGRSIYDSEQIQESGILIDWLESLYPGLKGEIEFSDVATPLSYERYTGNWQGSSCGWLLTKNTMLTMIRGMKKTLPGLDKFYLIGQWVEPGGGVPIAAMSGKTIVQRICKEDKKKFRACPPN